MQTDLNDIYWISPLRGFLPEEDPLRSLAGCRESSGFDFGPYEDAVRLVAFANLHSRKCSHRQEVWDRILTEIGSLDAQLAASSPAGIAWYDGLVGELAGELGHLRKECTGFPRTDAACGASNGGVAHIVLGLEDVDIAELAEEFLTAIEAQEPEGRAVSKSGLSREQQQAALIANFGDTQGLIKEVVPLRGYIEQLDAEYSGQPLDESRFVALRARQREVLQQLRPAELQRLYVILTILAHSYIYADLRTLRAGSVVEGTADESIFPKRLTTSASHFLTLAASCCCSTRAEYQKSKVSAVLPVPVLPAQLAIPYYIVAIEMLGITYPVLTHSGVDLWNWAMPAASTSRAREGGALNLADLRLISSITGTEGESWFHLVVAQIAFVLGPIMSKAYALRTELAGAEGLPAVSAFLSELLPMLKEATVLISRMGECCDPQWFYHEYRLYLQGWGTNDDTPRGVRFEGIAGDGTANSAADQCGIVSGTAGGSAAQFGGIQVIDAVLGIVHEGGQSGFLKEQQQYMPRKHREFIESFDGQPTVNRWLKEARATEGSGGAGPLSDSVQEISDLYDDCVTQLALFRKAHWGIVKTHILRVKGLMESPSPEKNPYFHRVAHAGQVAEAARCLLQERSSLLRKASAQGEQQVRALFQEAAIDAGEDMLCSPSKAGARDMVADLSQAKGTGGTALEDFLKTLIRNTEGVRHSSGC